MKQALGHQTDGSGPRAGRGLVKVGSEPGSTFSAHPEPKPVTALLARMRRSLGLADDEHAGLVRLCESAAQQVEARAVVADEGEPQSLSYLILDGWACRCRFADTTRRQITSLLLLGDFSNPELDIDPKLGIDHMVCSLTPVTYAVVDTEELAALVSRSPGLAQALRRQHRREQSIQRELVVSLGRRNATERIAHLFCELHRRLGSATGHSLTIDMPLFHADLADVVGLTPIHVGRMLKRLQALGLIKSAPNSITIHDLVGLERLCCFDETYLRLAGVV